jgi:hypothetical protein
MKSALKRLFEVNFFFPNVLIPVIALTVYCASFAYLSSRFQLEGVNYFFASKLGRYLLFAAGGMLVIFLVTRRIRPNDTLVFRNTNEKLYPGDFLLLLLPLTPVVQYILNNQAILSLQDSLYVLITLALFSGVYIFVLPAVLAKLIPSRTLMIMGLAFVVTIVSMALVSDYFAWFEKGALRKQLFVLGGVFIVVWILYNLNQKMVLYLFIVANLIVNSVYQLSSQASKRDTSTVPLEENKLLSSVQGKLPVRTPNVYLLVYDAYVPNETLLGYGIDNSAQESYLEEQGFTLYPHTYSIAGSTLSTMSRVLNASTEYYGSSRRAVSGDGVIHKILKDLGYETYGLFYSDFMFQGVRQSYDYAIPRVAIPAYVQLLKAVFLGEFRFDIEQAGFSEQTRDQFVASKQAVFKNASEEQHVFIYMHSNLPTHSQNSGACRPNETKLFQKRLRAANIEMGQDIDWILGNDPNAIVIIAGDHGPYLTKNCFVTADGFDPSEVSRLDIQDRHGTFLAIRWPTGDFTDYDDITVLQDLFPAVFAYLYQDTTLLEAKIEPVILTPNRTISGLSVHDGIIQGGIDDGEPLFLSGK